MAGALTENVKVTCNRIVERKDLMPIPERAPIQSQAETSVGFADIGAVAFEHPDKCANILERIVEPYDPCRPDAAYSNAAMRAMEDYARSRIHQLRLPVRVHPKFSKLRNALAVIPYVAPMDQDSMLRQYPELRGLAKLLETCLARYPEILTGEVNPLSVLFPGGSVALVEAVYRDNPVTDYFNKVVGDIVANYIRLRSGQNTRIIEIGAGTGATTQFVLPAISTSNVTYLFTDLSFGFLNKAKVRFAHHKFVDYRVYNIEKRPEADHQFDIVIAANVLHATVDIRNALKNARDLLSPEGILVVNEFTSRQDYATLTFGLTEGWWLNADGQRIQHSALLTGEAWRSLIRGAGFYSVASHGNEDQQVIVAAASGNAASS